MKLITKAQRHIVRAKKLSSHPKTAPLTKAKEVAIIAKIRKDREQLFLSRY